MKQTTTNNIRILFFLLGILCLSMTTEAQIININNDDDPESDYDLQQLVEMVLVSGNCAEVGAFELQTFGSSRETKSFGYFRRPVGSSFPFEEGIVLSTGSAFPAGNVTSATLVSTDNGDGLGDADLEAALGISNTNDATFVKFEFAPTSNDFSFDFLMASEEYDGNTECNFADGFAFLIREKGTTAYTNLAVLPDNDSDPTNNVPVSVTNINDSNSCRANEEFFEGYNIPDTNFGGRTKILTASFDVTPGVIYEIKLVVADQGDSVWDSAIFLNAGDFNFGLDLGADLVASNNNAVCGESIELMSNIPDFNYQWLFNGTAIPGATSQSYIASSIPMGGLGPGTYRCEISSTDGTCTGQDELEVEFVESATINPIISDIQVCDADGDLTEVFDLTINDTDILDGQDPATFEVRYFTDAAYTNQITNPAAFSNTSPSQTIYVRVVNRNSTNCAADNSFTIGVTGQPLPEQSTDYVICDNDSDGDDTDGFVQTFMLVTKDLEILGTLDPAQYSVSYHTTLVGAQTDALTDVIDKNVDYSNTTANSQQIFVRVENTDNPDCNSSDITFNLVVAPLPNPNPVIELIQCDIDTDGFSIFNLFEAGQLISSNFANETFEFFNTEADAIAGTNAILIPTAYANISPTTETVWARTISVFDCYRISQVDLTVATNSAVVSSIPVQTFEACDDFLDEDGNDTVDNDDTDGITLFDFDEVTDIVLNEFPASEQSFLTVNFYRNETDALSELNAIDNPGAYRNIDYPNTQQIYVRVDNTLNNGCEGVVPLITLNVLPVPNVRQADDLRLCDNGDDGLFDNGIVQTFNLDAQTPVILDGQDPNVFTVTYHLSAAEALSGANAIASTAAYENIVPNQQTIYVRVQNNTTGCFTNHTSFDLFVDELPVANPVTDLEICDTIGLPVDGTAQNGISTFINLHAEKTLDILGGQDPTQFIVTYHTTLANAQNGVNPVGGTLANPTNFTNSVPFLQPIYVRVVNGDTGCANDVSEFNIIVHPEPETFEISNISICDDGVPGDDPNLPGVVETFDFNADIILEILGDNQDINDFTVTFHETITQAQTGTDALSSPYTNTMPFEQDIFVRVVNNITGCVNDDFTFKIFVKPLPTFEVTTPQIVCLNGPELTLSVENPLTIYDYTWITPTGETFNGPELTITSGEGFYSVIASSTDDAEVVCSYEQQIFVQESIIANLTEASVNIEDESDNNTITIDPTNLGIGDYDYALLDESEENFVRNYQDDPVFDNLPGGIYTILARDKNGCGVARLRVPVVQYPKFFTPNNDGRNDTWTIKGANSEFFPGSEVNVFNRFGKLVAKINIDGPGWDGTFNGRVLPSDDYWFSVKLFDQNGNPVKGMIGNVSLLRK